jgi:hypothetical protein
MPSNNLLRFKKHAEEGELTLDHFDVVTEAVPELKDGEVTRRSQNQVHFVNKHLK